MKDKLRNIGPKSAAWLRQVGVHDRAALVELGAVEAFLRVKRAGFRPSLNLVYALEAALLDCHWQALDPDLRDRLTREAEAACAELPPKRGKPMPPPEPVTLIDGGD